MYLSKYRATLELNTLFDLLMYVTSPSSLSLSLRFRPVPARLRSAEFSGSVLAGNGVAGEAGAGGARGLKWRV